MPGSHTTMHPCKARQYSCPSPLHELSHHVADSKKGSESSCYHPKCDATVVTITVTKELFTAYYSALTDSAILVKSTTGIDGTSSSSPSSTFSFAGASSI